MYGGAGRPRDTHGGRADRACRGVRARSCGRRARARARERALGPGGCLQLPPRPSQLAEASISSATWQGRASSAADASLRGRWMLLPGPGPRGTAAAPPSWRPGVSDPARAPVRHAAAKATARHACQPAESPPTWAQRLLGLFVLIRQTGPCTHTWASRNLFGTTSSSVTDRPLRLKSSPLQPTQGKK